jgi:hypothetical protein
MVRYLRGPLGNSLKHETRRPTTPPGGCYSVIQCGRSTRSGRLHWRPADSSPTVKSVNGGPSTQHNKFQALPHLGQRSGDENEHTTQNPDPTTRRTTKQFTEIADIFSAWCSGSGQKHAGLACARPAAWWGLAAPTPHTPPIPRFLASPRNPSFDTVDDLPQRILLDSQQLCNIDDGTLPQPYCIHCIWYRRSGLCVLSAAPLAAWAR